MKLCRFASFLLASVAAAVDIDACSSWSSQLDVMLLQTSADVHDSSKTTKQPRDMSMEKYHLAEHAKIIGGGSMSHTVLAFFRGEQTLMAANQSNISSEFVLELENMNCWKCKRVNYVVRLLNWSIGRKQPMTENSGSDTALGGLMTFAMNTLDILWLWPFLKDPMRWKQNTVVFMLTQIIFVLLAAGMAWVELGVSNDRLAEVLTIASPALLTVISLMLFVFDNKEQKEGPQVGLLSAIALISNLDVFAVYVPILAEGIITPVLLLVAIILLSALNVGFCLLTYRSTVMSQILLLIPLWASLGIIAGLSWIEAFT